MKLFTVKELEEIDDVLFLMYMDSVELKPTNLNLLKKFTKSSDKVVYTASMIMFLSKLLKKHPQKLYPNQLLRK